MATETQPAKRGEFYTSEPPKKRASVTVDLLGGGQEEFARILAQEK